MARFIDTKYAGMRAEETVKDVLSKYTKYIYTNLRVDTLLTKNGFTEIDIIAAVSDVLLVVEVKNVKRITGSVKDPMWVLQGAERGEEYTALNVLTQNRIHVRSLKDAWFINRGEFPVVISVVVVPNICEIPDELQECGIMTVSDFSVQVARLCADSESTPKYGYSLQFVVGSDSAYLYRKDFTGGSDG